KCPLAGWCKARGAVERAAKAPRQRRIVAYGLSTRDDAVFLVRRPQHTGLMPGLWELPDARLRPHAPQPSAMRLRHSIMNTDYSVIVVRRSRTRPAARGQWIARRRLARLPLTGLARKILRRAAVIE
ncbi:MAG: hypothetical protein ACRD2M_01970, partial [Terriglobales bacterium]